MVADVTRAVQAAQPLPLQPLDHPPLPSPPTPRFSNKPKVDVRAAAFGDANWGDDPATIYMGKTSDYFISKGYVAGKDLFTLPYDFRQSLPGLEQLGLFSAMKAKIEAVKAKAGGPVVLIGHSMGCLVSQAFLHKMTDDWA